MAGLDGYEDYPEVPYPQTPTLVEVWITVDNNPIEITSLPGNMRIEEVVSVVLIRARQLGTDILLYNGAPISEALSVYGKMELNRFVTTGPLVTEPVRLRFTTLEAPREVNFIVNDYIAPPNTVIVPGKMTFHQFVDGLLTVLPQNITLTKIDDNDIHSLVRTYGATPINILFKPNTLGVIENFGFYGGVTTLKLEVIPTVNKTSNCGK